MFAGFIRRVLPVFCAKTCPKSCPLWTDGAVGATWDDENIGDFTEISPKLGKSEKILQLDGHLSWKPTNMLTYQHGDKLWQDYGK